MCICCHNTNFTSHLQAPNTSTSPGASRQSDTAGVSASSSSRHRDRPTVTSEGVGATSGGDRAGGTETLVEVGGARRLVPLAADREHHCETEQGPKQTSNRPVSWPHVPTATNRLYKYHLGI